MNPLTANVTAIALFSGGLDSILACRVIQAQGVTVRAFRFVTPFFGYDLLRKRKEYAEEVRGKYGIEVQVEDVSEEYLKVLSRPRYGYGKNFNPCLDCKIFLVGEARGRMAALGAAFLFTGEVLGQRPMSQRRDTLRIVERDSGCDGLLLRPLCARHLPPTRAEEEGLVARERLLDFTGRGRKGQIELARELGVADYPAPAGGCTLTDPILSRRLRRFFTPEGPPQVADVLLLLVGRHFLLPGGGWLAMGRDERENTRLRSLAGPGDLVLNMTDRPGPTAVLRGSPGAEDLLLAAGLVVRYAKKGPQGPAPGRVAVESKGSRQELTAAPLADSLSREWLI